MRDADGKIVGIMGISRDITDRKQAEEALRRSREEFKDLFDNAPVGFHELDAEGRLTRINNTELKMLGYTAEELLGQFVWKLSTDEEMSRRATLAKLGGGQTPAQGYERMFRRKDGSTIPSLVHDRLMKNADGVITGIHSTIEDITARKAAEKSLARRTAELARERLFLRTLIDNLPDIIFAKDAQSRFTLVNTACAGQLGAGSVEAVPGKTDADFVSPELASQYLADEKELMQSGRPVTKEEAFQHKGTGEIRWSLTTKVPLKDDAGKVVGLIGIARDITDRKAAEAQLQNTMADLERSNKELEQFAYIASHDLQEPLRMVSSYTQLLAKRFEGQLDEKTQKYVHYAVDGASRMQSLINDLLAYSRVGRRGKPLESADSHAILGEALRNLAARIEETHAVITNGDLPTVRADASQLVLVFQNLISNAIKFRREGIPGIHVSARDKGGEWLFAVKDNGIGIESRHAQRVFEIFQRLHTREEYPGTGIGLSVCKRVVERHGGKIWFESEPGSGTTFFFTIPK
jgi:PAS domain S-box-containing protein